MSAKDVLVQCEVCGEYRGSVPARLLCWPVGTISESEPQGVLTFSCICSGIPCPRCRKNKIPRPVSNFYDPVRNELVHVPAMAGMFGSCDECREKRAAANEPSRAEAVPQLTDDEVFERARELLPELAQRLTDPDEPDEDEEVERCTLCGGPWPCDCPYHCCACGARLEECRCGARCPSCLDPPDECLCGGCCNECLEFSEHCVCAARART